MIKQHYVCGILSTDHELFVSLLIACWFSIQSALVPFEHISPSIVMIACHWQWL